MRYAVVAVRAIIVQEVCSGSSKSNHCAMLVVAQRIPGDIGLMNATPRCLVL